jgi:hypothetical protein
MDALLEIRTNSRILVSELTDENVDVDGSGEEEEN